jgi:hypothetical protein
VWESEREREENREGGRDRVICKSDRGEIMEQGVRERGR